MPPIVKYVVKRLCLLTLVLFVVVTLTFILSHVVPGDPARLWAGPRAVGWQIQKARVELGFDKPLWVQYFDYWARLLRGDFGVSIHTHRPVANDLIDYFPATFELTTVSMAITIVLGMLLGVLSAVHRDKAPDHASRIYTLTGVSMPVFWLGIMFQLILGSRLGILPIAGRIDVMVEYLHPVTRITGLFLLDTLLTGNILAFTSALAHIAMPALTLSFATLAIVSRMMRALMIEVLDQDYIRTARSLGLTDKLVTYKYALKNALIPVITVVGLSYGYSLGGAFLIERVFNWPGLGTYVTDSIVTLDYPAILGTVVLITVVYVVVNLLTDIIYAYLNPKIRY